MFLCRVMVVLQCVAGGGGWGWGGLVGFISNKCVLRERVVYFRCWAPWRSGEGTPI